MTWLKKAMYTYIGHCFKDQRIVSNLHHWGDKDLQVRVMNGEFHIVFIGGPGATSLWRQMVRLAVSS